MTLRSLFLLTSSLALTGACFAQVASAEFRGNLPLRKDWTTLHLETKIGSFKLIDGTGKVEFTFQGSVMLNVGKEGTYSVTGDVKKNFDRSGRVSYFGKGRVVVTGRWRSVQWFGREMKLIWYGTGFARVSSQFYPDPVTKKPRTGEWWYDNDERNFMIADGTMTIMMPRPQMRGGDGPAQVVPRERKSN